MSYWNIAVIPMAGLDREAADVRKRMNDAWQIQPNAIFTHVSLEDFTVAMMEDFDAAVFVVNADDKHSAIVRPLSELDELHIPTLALLDKAPKPKSVFESAGVMIDARNAPGLILCARLHGMMHRQREVNRLRHDVAMSRLSQGGLGQEIARMQDELQLAAQAQRYLLPDAPPCLHGVTVWAFWQPAQYVSGDIYEISRLDDDHIGVFLADSVGHGIAAALMTMVISQSLTTKERVGDGWRILDPAEVLGRLNEKLIGRRIHPSRFATAVYAVVNCRSRQMAVASAGHPPPFVVHEGGRAETLETSGGLLGVFDDEKYDQTEFELAAGDRLLLYTDGFERAFPQDNDRRGQRLPTHRYREEFEALCRTGPPQDMMDNVRRRLEVQTGSLHQLDDLTLLCLHVGGLPGQGAKDPGAEPDEKIAA